MAGGEERKTTVTIITPPLPTTSHVKDIHLILDNSYTGYLVCEPWGKVHQPDMGREGGSSPQ